MCIRDSLESAQKRGAKILGEVIGYGFSSNGAHISNPTVDGPIRSLYMALKDAGMSSADIDYINAHATSTPAGDASEAKAIHEVFGDHRHCLLYTSDAADERSSVDLGGR